MTSQPIPNPNAEIHGNGYPVTIDVQSDPLVERLGLFDGAVALRAAEILNEYSAASYIDLSKVRHAIDFGSGGGGPTLALVQLGRTFGTEVEAVEKDQRPFDELIKRGVLSAGSAHLTDGIDFLAMDSSANKYDLITAFSLDPCFIGRDMPRFLEAADHALSSNGRMLVYSDGATMTNLRQACNQLGLKYLSTRDIREPVDLRPHSVVVLPRAA
jgi:tRNA1(Val) A37 N6-methylase TrmN6